MVSSVIRIQTQDGPRWVCFIQFFSFQFPVGRGGPAWAHVLPILYRLVSFTRSVSIYSQNYLSFLLTFFFFENLSELSSLGIKRYTYPCHLNFLSIFLCVWHNYFCQFNLQINLFLLLFMSFIEFFGIIYESELNFIRMGVKPMFYTT